MNQELSNAELEAIHTLSIPTQIDVDYIEPENPKKEYAWTGHTKTDWIRITEKKLIDLGIKEGELYSPRYLSELTEVSLPSISRLMRNVPRENKVVPHHNPKIKGVLNAIFYKGEEVLRYFRERDRHFSVNGKPDIDL